MKSTTTLFLILVMVLLVSGFVFASVRDDSPTLPPSPKGNVVSGSAQKVIITEKNSNYYPQEINVKANQPVEITLDDQVKGCLRSFTIRELGVAQYARTAADKILFTPTKKGTFAFSCSMGMGYGKLIVS